MKNNFLVCAIWDFVLAAFFILIGFALESSLFMFIYGLIIFTIGAICMQFYNCTITQLNEAKSTVLVIGVISIFLNFFTGIILLVTQGKIYSVYKSKLESGELENEKLIDKRILNIDTLIKIGVAMVTIAGIIISTSSWDVLSEISKILIMSGTGIIFIILSVISNKKLKIKSTTITYLVVAMIFFVFDLILVILYFDLNVKIVLLAISILLLIGNLAKSEQVAVLRNVNKVSFILTLILMPIAIIVLLENMEDVENIWMVSTIAIINIFSLSYIAVQKNNVASGMLAPIGIISLSSLLVSNILYFAEIETEIISLVIAITLATTYSIFKLSNLINKNNVFNVVYKVIFNLAFFFLFISVININSYITMIIVALAVALNLLNRDFILAIISAIFVLFPVNNIITEYFGEVPIWLYLLVGGLAIIIIATVMQFKSSEKIEENKEN